MLKIISSLFDRALFTLIFILGIQLPEFIQQYTQRLSGHLNEALSQLNQYQLIANNHFNGNLKSMIEQYFLNSEDSIKETAHIIVNTSNRASNLQSHLINIQEVDYIKRVYYFITEFDESMATATLEQYQLAIPLSLPALITGGLFAVTIIIVSHLLMHLTKLAFRKIIKKQTTFQPRHKKNNPDNKAQHYLTRKTKVKTIKQKTVSKIFPIVGDIDKV